MHRIQHMSNSKLWISILIVLAIGLHAVPVLSYRGLHQNRWPFLAWAMYAASRPPGPIQTMNRRIIATTSKGERQEVTPWLAGVRRPVLRNNYTQPMWVGDSAAATQLFRKLNRGRSDPFVELQVEGERFTVTDTGIAKEDLRGIRYRIEPSEGSEGPRR